MSKTKTETRDVAELLCPNKVDARDFYTWNGKIQIPPICPSLNQFTSACRIIEIEYYIDLYFDVNTMSFSSDILIPITIGTVPLNNGNTTNSLLPSYESCMYGAGDFHMPNEDSNEKKGKVINSDESSFVPVYPYYKFD